MTSSNVCNKGSKSFDELISGVCVYFGRTMAFVCYRSWVIRSCNKVSSFLSTLIQFKYIVLIIVILYFGRCALNFSMIRSFVTDCSVPLWELRKNYDESNLSLDFHFDEDLSFVSLNNIYFFNKISDEAVLLKGVSLETSSLQNFKFQSSSNSKLLFTKSSEH